MSVPAFLSRSLIACALVALPARAGFAADFGAAVKGLAHQDGLIDTYVDSAKARVLVTLPKPDADGVAGRYIYAAYLTGGLGSNPMGLDHSLPGDSQIIAFKQIGDHVAAVIENTAYTASGAPEEAHAVKNSFARSIVWSTPVVATDKKTGELLIDLSGFLKRDAIGVAARLEATGQGHFKLDPSRSYVDTKEAHAFPINDEFDSYITFAGTKPGPEVVTTTPVPEAVTLIAHSSFIKLPAPGYVPEKNDERAAIIGISKVDMSAPLDGDTVVKLVRRFRLQKDKDGHTIKPIIMYVDNAAPEPIRSALVEGASWWKAAFAAAGFPDGYQVKVLPKGVHPLDARYNVINWVHRATRGWSYGAAIHDPRTGETIRGLVLLGSLRVRQDIRIFEALAGAEKTGTGAPDDPVQLALARIRQLAAHETGHALGFAHNMAASTVEGGHSVMDYPAPDVRAKADGTLDFSHAYGVGIGGWDKWNARFLYGDEDHAKLIKEADAKGLVYIRDEDSRPISSGEAQGALWDTGTDPLASLENTLKVRRIALDKFGPHNLRKGESYGALQAKFVPLYLYDRYQLQAAAKSLGGLIFQYRHKGDGRPAPSVVPVARQQEALQLLLQTVSPATLDVKPSVLDALTPVAYADGDPTFVRETFKAPARPEFDLMGIARASADITFNAMLASPRLARVAAQDLKGLGLSGLFADATKTLLMSPRGESRRHQRLREVVADVYTDHLIALTFDADTPPNVRAAARAALGDVRKAAARLGGDMGAYGRGLIARIEDALARGRTPAVKPASGPSIPPGSPIGASDGEDCWFCDTDTLINR